MDKGTKTVLQIVTIASVAVIIPTAVIAAIFIGSTDSSGLPDNYVGWGDWKACAEIASVQPKEAVDIAAEELGISFYELRWKSVDFGPVFVEPTGKVSNLMCSGGITVGSERTPWEHPTFLQESYAWEISIGTPGTLCMPNLSFVKWNTTESLYHIHGC